MKGGLPILYLTTDAGPQRLRTDVSFIPGSMRATLAQKITIPVRLVT
jgi:hypothetical protein